MAAPRNARLDSAVPSTLDSSTVSVVTNPAPPATIGDGTEKQAHVSLLEKTRAELSAQPKVRIRIRKEDGDQTVQINGWTYWIKAGEWVEVPQQVAEILEEAELI